MPSVVGPMGIPVPSIQESLDIQRISNEPLPRVKMLLAGAPCSATRKVTPLMTQLFGPKAESRLVTSAAVLKRMKLSAIPLIAPEAFVAVEPETVSAPAAP